MRFSDKIETRGDFFLKVYKNGKCVETYHEKNMIMNVAREALAKLVGGDGSAKVITYIGFGTNGDGPTPDGTALTNVYKKNLSGHTYPETGQVCFSWNLGKAEYNGKSIQEFGLLCDDNTLFARRTRGIIAKEDDIELSGTWTIKF